jgi:4-amino-4-deoxy-L-arabinose transferase-like glycosyltransferase
VTAWIGKLKDVASKFTIFHFLTLYFAVHLLQIAFPSDGSMVFDEAYYTKCSLSTLQGIACNAEHPPLPKLIGAFGIWLWGNNWFGWRFPVVLMGIGSLYLLYLIAKRLIGDPWALGATMLLGFDSIWFIHSGTLLLEMPMFLFVLLGIELYLRHHPWLSAVSMGVAFFSREMAFFPFFALVCYHIYTHRKAIKPALKLTLKYGLLVFVICSLLTQSYDNAYHPYSATASVLYVGKNVVMNNSTALTTITSTSASTTGIMMKTFVDNMVFMWAYHGPTGMNFPNEPYAPFKYPWNWILPFDPMPYKANATEVFPVILPDTVQNQKIVWFPPEPLSAPTYYRVDVVVGSGNNTRHYTPIIYTAQANLALWYWFIPGLAVLVWAFRKGRDKAPAFFIGAGMLASYLPWLFIGLTVKRIGFNYYMIYALPFIALAAAFSWKQFGKYGRAMMVLNLIAAFAFFITYFPVHPMP